MSAPLLRKRTTRGSERFRLFEFDWPVNVICIRELNASDRVAWAADDLLDEAFRKDLILSHARNWNSAVPGKAAQQAKAL
jgi:hypothetical protein